MGQSILVIDDDPFFRTLIHDFLEQNGFQVAVATSWVDFSAAYHGGKSAPDVILFDVNLGTTVPGDKLLSTFKKGRTALHSAKKAKLVLLSSLPEGELSLKTQECGADGYIRKSTISVKSGAVFLAKLRLYLTKD